MREAIIEALKKQYPNAKDFFLTPLVDLYLKNPEEIKRLAKEGMKQEKKKKEEPTPQCIYEGIQILSPPKIESQTIDEYAISN